MEFTEHSPFIFFLTLDEKLSAAFYTFDRLLKEHGHILVPVRVDQLQGLVSSTDQSDIMVICSVTSFHEYKIFNEKVRGLLKFILKSKRLTFMQLSSFSKLNDTKNFLIAKNNYYFMKYPLDASLLASKIVRYQDLKSAQSSRWPGGKRAGLKSVAA